MQGEILIVLVLVATASLTPPVAASCTWNGHTFAEGTTYKPDPCTFCTCRGGQPMCAIADCALPSCVDMVHDPTKCCPTCPNGINCRAPDGTIIPAGQEVVLANGRHCRCSSSGGFFGSHEAVCSVN